MWIQWRSVKFEFLEKKEKKIGFFVTNGTTFSVKVQAPEFTAVSRKMVELLKDFYNPLEAVRAWSITYIQNHEAHLAMR